MIADLGKASQLPDLRRRIIFTLSLIALYRLGAHVPVPFVNVNAANLQDIFNNGVLGLLDLFSGGALSSVAVFALGIMPFITAAIIMQLLTHVIPALEELQKEGETGQKKITQYTRYFTLVLAVMQSTAFTIFLLTQNAFGQISTGSAIVVGLSLTAGAMLVMWLGELITHFGIGNGMSLMMFASIVASFPIATQQSLATTTPFLVILSLAVLIAMAVAIVFIESGQRRIPVQYAKRMVGRKVYGGATSYLPFKLNPSGVIPIIFASSLLLFPATFAQFLPATRWMAQYFNAGSPIYLTLFAALVIFFTYFYTAVVFNPIKQADQIRKYGGFVPGVRPGKPTANYLNSVLTRLLFVGALFLAALAVVPSILFNLTQVQYFAQFGGTSVLIMVGVALELMRQIEARLLMRQYEGFLK